MINKRSILIFVVVTIVHFVTVLALLLSSINYALSIDAQTTWFKTELAGQVAYILLQPLGTLLVNSSTNSFISNTIFIANSVLWGLLAAGMTELLLHKKTNTGNV